MCIVQSRETGGFEIGGVGEHVVLLEVYLLLLRSHQIKKRSYLIGISEKQRTCSRTKGVVEKGKIALDN